MVLGHRQRVGKHTLGQSMAGLDERGRYCRNYLTVYDLLTHLDDTLPEDLLQYIQVGDWQNGTLAPKASCPHILLHLLFDVHAFFRTTINNSLSKSHSSLCNHYINNMLWKRCDCLVLIVVMKKAFMPKLKW